MAKDKFFKFRVDDEFLANIDYLKRIRKFNKSSELMRALVEEECNLRRDHEEYDNENMEEEDDDEEYYEVF